MKIPLSWLKEYIDLPAPPKIAEALVQLGIEVEAVDVIRPSFTNVVVAEIIDVQPHPQAEKLKIATVFDGTEKYQVVCGAPHCHKGMLVPFAKEGAELKDLKIKKATLRGVDSYGMLCTEKELQIGEDHEQLLVLDGRCTIGENFAGHIEDVVFDLSLTPNLGYALNVQGIARELSHFLQIPLKERAIPHFSEISDPLPFSLEIDDTEGCMDYCCGYIKNVQIGPSPFWLKRRLALSGVRSINNAVDITNFVMLGKGQPMHVFDADKVEGGIVVSSKTHISSLVTLDHMERKFPEKTLLICDKKKPLAIAGIMGGLHSGVTDKTDNIILESALFAPQRIRKASKALGLRSESSLRFEKGVDPEGIEPSLREALSLMHHLTGGKVVKTKLRKTAHPYKTKTITLNTLKLNSLLGLDLSENEISSLLQRSDVEVFSENSHLFKTIPPSYRLDLKEEVDLIEEVARLYGYDNIPRAIQPILPTTVPHHPLYLFEKKMRSHLLSEGLQEWISCDLISPEMAEKTTEPHLQDKLIRVLHPSSQDHSILRASLLTSLLGCIKFNLDRGQEDLSIFEIGKIHFKEESYTEQLMAAILLMGKKAPFHFDPPTKEVDFFDLKGIVENTLTSLGITNAIFSPSHLHTLHPFRQASITIDGTLICAFGEVHPGLLNKLQIQQRVLFAQMDLQLLLPLEKKTFAARPFSTLPTSSRDWTLTLSEKTPLSSLFNILSEFSSPYLTDALLIDIYRSPNLGEEKKNVTLRFIYQDKEKTIELQAVETEHAKLTAFISQRLKN